MASYYTIPTLSVNLHFLWIDPGWGFGAQEIYQPLDKMRWKIIVFMCIGKPSGISGQKLEGQRSRLFRIISKSAAGYFLHTSQAGVVYQMLA